MRGQPGFFDIDERMQRLSGLGDHLEAFSAGSAPTAFAIRVNLAVKSAP